MNKIYLIFFLSLMACSPPSVEKYHNAETEEDVVSLFNERQYGKAIWLIENKHGRDPIDTRTALLLAEGYLGKVGLEPLNFASLVVEKQPNSDLVSFFPDCSNERLSSLFRGELKCILKRVYLHAPLPDHPDFKRARELLRRAYPNPEQTPQSTP